MAAAWIVAYVSDSLAFRLDATVEALAPATGLFLFTSILADDAHRTWAAALFLVAVLAFAALAFSLYYFARKPLESEPPK